MIREEAIEQLKSREARKYDYLRNLAIVDINKLIDDIFGIDSHFNISNLVYEDIGYPKYIMYFSYGGFSFKAIQKCSYARIYPILKVKSKREYVFDFMNWYIINETSDMLELIRRGVI